jgi:hypothetical protein
MRWMWFDKLQRLKSTPQSAAPNVLGRPGRPCRWRELDSPRMKGIFGVEGRADMRWEELSCLAIEAMC